MGAMDDVLAGFNVVSKMKEAKAAKEEKKLKDLKQAAEIYDLMGNKAPDEVKTTLGIATGMEQVAGLSPRQQKAMDQVASHQNARTVAEGGKILIKPNYETGGFDPIEAPKTALTAEKDEAAKSKKDKENLDREKEQLTIAEKKDELAKKQYARTPKGKMEALSSSDKQRFDNLIGSLTALNGMRDALAAGSNTFSVVGDNDFTRHASTWDEMIGRMQSGGAIGKEEAKKFRKLVPVVTDPAEQQQSKLNQMEALMSQRLSTMGFSPKDLGEMGISVKPIKQGSKSPYGNLSDAELDAQLKARGLLK